LENSLTSHEDQPLRGTGALTVLQRDIDRTRLTLTRWLAARQSTPVEVSGLHRPVGAGTSNDTLLFAVDSEGPGTAHHLELVLRIQPGDYQLFLDPRFHEQYQLQQALHDSALVRVARPFWFEPDSGYFGQPFYVMERLPGRVPVSFPPYNQAGFLFEATPREREKLWLSAMGELARIHRVPLERVAFLGEPERGATGFEQHLQYQLAYAQWATEGRAVPFMERTLEWLLAHQPTAPQDGLSWGDARIGNMMFSQDFTVSGVMDWEQCSLGGGMQDLGWWTLFDDAYSHGIGLKRLEGLGTRDDTVAVWEALTGLRCHDLLWYEVFAGWKLAVILCRKFALEGDARRGNNRSHNLFTRLIAQRLDWAPPEDEVTG